MYPYLIMLGLPSGLALTSSRARRFGLLAVATIYFLMIGFRFQVGMDWNNYLVIYQSKEAWDLSKLLLSSEPGYGFLMWVGMQLGWGMIFVNAVSALIFSIGFFAVAKRCSEPWLAIAIATPLLVIAFAMSGVRQAIAAGIIFYLFAHWGQYSTPRRILLVVIASLFHFSAIFAMIFVALGSHAPNVVRIGGAILFGILVAALAIWAPDALEAYSRLYVGGQQSKLSAPGAIFQILPLAFASLIYLLNRQTWVAVHGDDPLYKNLAWAALISLPAILVSSVGAYRFALYFWPMAMTVYGGIPAMIENMTGRLFFRICIVFAAFALLFGWLLLGNNSYAWLPYQNWLLQPDGIRLLRGHHH